MADAAVVLEFRRRDASPLTSDERSVVDGIVSRIRQLELVSELGETAVWRADDSFPEVGRFVVFELWGEDIELNVLETDGSIRPPRFVTRVIDGETIEVPEAPPEGNPGADEMLSLLLERNKARLEVGLRGLQLPAHLSAGASAEHW